MQLSAADLVAKWLLRFADNDTFEIDEADFREFTQDVADSLGAGVAVFTGTAQAPQAVTQGWLYVAGQATVWRARRSFNASAAPVAGANWELLLNAGATSFASLTGGPADNAALAATLAGKADLDASGKVPLAQTPQQYKYLYDYPAGQTTAPEYRIAAADAAGYYALERVSNVDAASLQFYLNDVQVAPDAQGRFTLALLDRFKIQATAPAGQVGYLILAQVL